MQLSQKVTLLEAVISTFEGEGHFAEEIDILSKALAHARSLVPQLFQDHVAMHSGEPHPDNSVIGALLEMLNRPEGWGGELRPGVDYLVKRLDTSGGAVLIASRTTSNEGCISPGAINMPTAHGTWAEGTKSLEGQEVFRPSELTETSAHGTWVDDSELEQHDL